MVNTCNFKIDTQCPQCGAPVVLGEADCIIKCDFCRTRHILHAHPFPCYYIEPRKEKNTKSRIIYIPYWRFKGLEFSLGEKKPEFKVVDHSCRAVRDDRFPVSLGFRSQTQTLKFFHQTLPGFFRPPDITQKDMLKRISEEDTAKKKVHIGEILSLIYMPFFQDNDMIIDGLSGKILAEEPAGALPDQKTIEIHRKFTPGLCPNCGWDLNGKTTSFVLHCTHCEQFWLIHHDKLNTIKVTVEHIEKNTDIMMPFWRFQIKFKTLALSTYAHLITFANLAKAVQKEDEKQPVYFYIPAFKINPKLFLRIGRQATMAQINVSAMGEWPKADFHPADISIEEGFQAVFPMLMEICANKRETWAVLKHERLKLSAFSLSYLSFQKSGSEFIQNTLKTTLPASSLRFGEKL